MATEAADFAPDGLRTGLTATFEREITEADVLAFASISGDTNPLHVDREYAGNSRFGRRIVHGAFQASLASAMAGMYLPGRRVLLGSVRAMFPAPLYFPCRVRVTGQISSWNRETQSGNLNVIVHDVRNDTATAEISMGFTFHETAGAPDQPKPVEYEHNGKPLVLVTGASGGLGSALIPELARNYSLIGITRGEGANNEAQIPSCQIDLRSDWESGIDRILAGRPLYGIVHTAWPGLPHGSLLQASAELVTTQVLFGSALTIRLAQFLFDRAPGEGGRCVAIGSIAGTAKPVLSLAAYSLGKATLEHTAKLLAPELARRQITINVVCPSFLPVGMNKQANERTLSRETAQVPLGRLCEPLDVAGLVSYLLSPLSAFITGQTLYVSGGQL